MDLGTTFNDSSVLYASFQLPNRGRAHCADQRRTCGGGYLDSFILDPVLDQQLGHDHRRRRPPEGPILVIPPRISKS